MLGVRRPPLPDRPTSPADIIVSLPVEHGHDLGQIVPGWRVLLLDVTHTLKLLRDASKLCVHNVTQVRGARPADPLRAGTTGAHSWSVMSLA